MEREPVRRGWQQLYHSEVGQHATIRSATGVQHAHLAALCEVLRRRELHSCSKRLRRSFLESDRLASTILHSNFAAEHIEAVPSSFSQSDNDRASNITPQSASHHASQ